MSKQSKNDPGYVYELLITLQGPEPSIWRKILVEKNITLGELHYIIQDSMGWEDSHLHQFRVKKKIYGSIDMDDRPPGEKDEESIDIQKLALDKIRKFEYEYDFGDGWTHEVEILRRVPNDASVNYPLCVGGERACPPEDSGGVLGFKQKLEVLQDTNHPQHDEIKDWMGEYDPEKFDVDEVNERFRLASEAFIDEVEDEIHYSMLDAFQTHCGFCNCDTGEDQEVFSLGIRVKEGMDIEGWEGEVVPFKMEGIELPVLGVAVTEESQAKLAGNDIVFQLCSEQCVKNLQAAIKKGFTLFIPGHSECGNKSHLHLVE